MLITPERRDGVGNDGSRQLASREDMVTPSTDLGARLVRWSFAQFPWPSGDVGAVIDKSLHGAAWKLLTVSG